ncbi:MAG TPA: HDOD domain-containing protein [Armatimonadetes bacterium]|jgi:putative nucleotidyltransferase with HDIG domain|nr:HDOD domain-containing protein [Armatimonadota bacterium]
MLADKVKQHVMELRGLPSLPEVVARVLQVVDNPRSSAADFGRAISLDPALTARILRLANSAFYGYTGRIGTAVQAVTILGFAQVRSLVLTVSVLDLFWHSGKKPALPHYDYWRHCIACAVAARALARRTRICPPEEAFVAGLLHDLGKMVLAMVIPEAYHQVVLQAEAEGRVLVEVEQECLGLTHPMVGGWVTEKWRLPVALNQAVERHHEWMAEMPGAGLARCVFLANRVVGGREFGWSGNGQPLELDARLPAAIGIDPAEVAAIPGEIAEDYQSACQLLDVTGAKGEGF